jgi:hypothetical protein
MDKIQAAQNSVPQDELAIADFCQQCKLLATRITVPVQQCHELLHINAGSNCPLCLFLISALHTQDLSIRLRTSDPLYLLSSRGTKTLEFPSIDLSKTYVIRTERRSVVRWLFPRIDCGNISFHAPNTDRLNYGLMKRWIAYCLDNHDNVCSDQYDTSWIALANGFKLIDCSTREIVALP